MVVYDTISLQVWWSRWCGEMKMFGHVAMSCSSPIVLSSRSLPPCFWITATSLSEDCILPPPPPSSSRLLWQADALRNLHSKI